ncbi:MAG: lipopolysaccharide heptosyltransferase I [Smithellaceae bacterium]
MNILIVKLSAIGDVIHTLPSLAALRKLYPAAHITWVVEEAAADVVRNHPFLDTVLISQRKSWIKNFHNGEINRPLREMRAFLRELRQRPYDLVIDFHGLLKSAIVVLLSGGKIKLGYDSLQELSGLFYNEKIPENMNKHAVDRYLDFPRYLGATVGKAEFVLPINRDTETKAQLLLNKYKLEDKKFIAINPIAYWETKLWDNEKFAKLADLIISNLNLDVVFTGSEKEEIEKIIDQMQTHAVNLGGETSLAELAYLYKKSQMVITTDSGPMHLAAAVKTPVIALFGPTDPARTGPYGDGHTIIRTKLPCSPCLLKTCPTKKCMQDILPEQVFAVVEEKLKKGINNGNQ